MKEINTGTSAFIFQDINELSDVDKKLMQAAIKASRNAYAPYSGFSVGAALLMEDDSIIIGNNQENAILDGLWNRELASADVDTPTSPNQ